MFFLLNNIVGVHVVIISYQLTSQKGSDINKMGRNLEAFFDELILNLPKDERESANRKTQVFTCICFSFILFLLKKFIIKIY